MRPFGWLGLVLLGVAQRAGAQGNAACANVGGGLLPPITQREVNVCNAAVDGARLFTPVAGVLMGAGNPFLAAPDGLGGFPHSGLTIRANLTRVVLPDLGYSGEGNTVGAGSRLWIPAPVLELGVGALPGTAGGNLAVDILGSAQFIPTSVSDKLHADVNANRIGSLEIGFGIGARVTLVPERTATPAVAVSLTRRSIPTIGVGSLVDGDQFAFRSNLRAFNYRITIAKSLGPAMVVAGAGWDDYSSKASIDFANPETGLPEPPIDVHVSDGRALAFVDGGAALRQFYLIGEVGVQRGKHLGLGTTFVDNDPGSARVFGSLGLRLGF
jgi:hypothetical protein